MTSADAGAYRKALEPIVRRAGAHLLAAFETLEESEVDRKGVVDLVTHLDVEAQAIIEAGLATAFPGEPIWAEEGAERSADQDGVLWLVDPLDGTTNFVHGVPTFAVSVARVRHGQVELGMVYAPYLRECFWASRTAGAELNGRPLHVSTRTELGDALLASGFPYDIRSNPRNNLAEWTHFATRCRGLRRCGSAALDLAYVAAGRFDAYWEFRLHPWDLAAGALLVEEAGERVTDPAGGSAYLWKGDVVASNGPLHDPLRRELQSAREE